MQQISEAYLFSSRAKSNSRVTEDTKMEAEKTGMKLHGVRPAQRQETKRERIGLTVRWKGNSGRAPIRCGKSSADNPCLVLQVRGNHGGQSTELRKETGGFAADPAAEND